MHTLRTRFAKDIVAEFLPPFLGNPNRKSGRVLILCDGVPSVPSKKAVLQHWSKKGYWVFHPRLRGTWESGGSFLQAEPVLDILDVIRNLKKPFVDQWNGDSYQCNPEKVFVMGASFGGATAVIASTYPGVTKAVAFSAVIDWQAPSLDEPISEYPLMTQRAFGEAYRPATPDAWRALQKGELHSPIAHAGKIMANKLMLIHAEDDTSVRIDEPAAFAEKTGCTLHRLKRGGHFSSSLSTRWQWSRRIHSFFGSS